MVARDISSRPAPARGPAQPRRAPEPATPEPFAGPSPSLGRTPSPQSDDALGARLQRAVEQRQAGTALLQRRVGFEWEMGSIRPWLVTEGTTDELVAALRANERVDEDSDEEGGEPADTAEVDVPTDPADWLRDMQEVIEGMLGKKHVPRGLLTVKPVGRKQVLHEAGQWRLEADDTPGPWRSNIEYVTEPFEETEEGIKQFHQAIDAIALLVERLRPAAAKRGPARDAGQFDDTHEEANLTRLAPDTPGGPYPRVLRGKESADELFLRHATHQLSGSDDVPPQQLAFSGTGGMGLGGKMQATIGVDLGALPQVMNVFGAAGASINEGSTGLAQNKTRNHPLYQLVDQAPRIAAAVVDVLESSGQLPGPRAKADGFLASLVMAILALASDATGQLKYRFVLMPRTSHAAMLASLPGAQMLKGHGAWLAGVIVSKIDRAEITAGSPLLKSVADADALTVEKWIAAIVDDGVDHLAPKALDTFLEKAGVQAQQRAVVGERLESFGTVAAGDRRESELLAVYEHRGIDPAGPALPIEGVRARGEAILRYLMAVRNRGDTDEPVAWEQMALTL